MPNNFGSNITGDVKISSVMCINPFAIVYQYNATNNNCYVLCFLVQARHMDEKPTTSTQETRTKSKKETSEAQSCAPVDLESISVNKIVNGVNTLMDET